MRRYGCGDVRSIVGWTSAGLLSIIAATACAAQTTDRAATPVGNASGVVSSRARPWTVETWAGVFHLGGDTLYEWDPRAHPGEIVERDVASGRVRRSRSIVGGRVNGTPRYWERVRGGYLVFWGEPVRIDETPDGRLVRGWAADREWGDEHAMVGDDMLTTHGALDTALVRLRSRDGTIAWSAPLAREAAVEGIVVHGRTAFAWWTADGRTGSRANPLQVGAFDVATGKRIWVHDLRGQPEALAITGSTIAALFDDQLRFIDGATHRVIASHTISGADRLHNPRLAGDGGGVYLTTDAAVRAFEVNGPPRWRRVLPMSNAAYLALQGDTVYVTLLGEQIAALDRSTGRERWRVGVGVDGYRFRASEHGVVWFADHRAGAVPAAAVPEVERATFRGRVVDYRCARISQAIVTIGDVRVPVDAMGRFEATVDASGIVVVEGPGAFYLLKTQTQGVARVEIPLTGRRSYTVPDLTLSDCAT